MTPWLRFVGLMLLIGMVACRPSSEPSAGPPPLKVAFLYAGASVDPAREAVAGELGARLHMHVEEQLGDEVAMEEALRSLVKEEHRLIFGMGAHAGAMVAMRHVAADAPSVHFEQLGGTKTTANMRAFEARTYEGAYLAGLVAGSLSQSHVLGVRVQTVTPSLEAVRIVNAFALGAQAVEPKSVTRVAGFDQGEASLGLGVDMVLHSTESGRISLQRVGASGEPLVVFAVDWAPYYRQTIQAALTEKWGAEPAWWGMREETVVLASLSAAVPAPLRQRVEQARDALRQGQAVIWSGPLFGQDGKPVLRQGELASDKFLYGMNFYIKGVEGQPQGL
jgi:simple sugar transport system substrate-binding protein